MKKKIKMCIRDSILTIRLKKADSGAPPLRELPAQW